MFKLSQSFIHIFFVKELKINENFTVFFLLLFFSYSEKIYCRSKHFRKTREFKFDFTEAELLSSE